MQWAVETGYAPELHTDETLAIIAQLACSAPAIKHYTLTQAKTGKPLAER
jgi:hypothetical protein